jgi:Zn-finger in ubiquitin-hydrolases and other protein/SnoaL-like polyketide cyclase
MGIEEPLGELDQRLRNGDFEALRTAMASEFFSYAPKPGEPAASDRIADLATALKAALPDLVAMVDDVEANADGSVRATVTVRGTHRNDLWGAPGSGDVIEWTTPVTIRAIGDKLAVRFDDTSTPQRVSLLRQLRLVNPADEMDQPPRYPVTPPDFLLKVVLTGEAGDKPCAHLDEISVTEPTVTVCQECADQGDIWPALRMCLVCGFVGCCDTSKHRHMAHHYETTGHSIFRSINRDEGWIWCYADDAFFEKTTLDRYRQQGK